MRAWIPVPGTTKERLVRSALDLFGQGDYETVSVQDLATSAGVTTGSLYHHFHGKPELYALVRRDVERRVADRVEAVLESGGGVGPALLAGYDWVVRAGYPRLVGAAPIESELFSVVAAAVGGPAATVTLAGWRAALTASAEDAAATAPLRTALASMLRT